MKFRKEQVDDVLTIESDNSYVFCQKILNLNKKYIVIDVQYALIKVSPKIVMYSALILVRRKR